MKLKKYQQQSIDIIKEYLVELNQFGPKHAFISITGEGYKEEAFGDVPCICIKIPTGGGKTFVASHSIIEIIDITLKNKLERGIVMWFVPSEAIKSQTLKKLKDRKDIHRKVLDEYFGNNVRIFSNEEAKRIRKEDVNNNLCIIISSLDAFRKEKKLQNKYKVYQENGELMDHFENVKDDSFLEKDKTDNVINSLVNVIKLNNPLIIIDEGHRTKTKLSIDFLRNLNPSFIIEYTATPRIESNILVKITSSQLKEEDMVKIPIILESVSQWQQAIKRGVLKRNELEKIAKKENDYIRPIVLLQAEQDKKSPKKVTVGDIKDFLINELKISEEEIAIKISNKNEIEGVNLFSQKCKIRYIITVNALAEGWDCSFAYLLISVANIGSKIAVEQIIGRIVRLPNAKKQNQESLNYSYVFASARNFNEAANQIINGLEKNGFSRSDIINIKQKDKKSLFDVHKKIKEQSLIPLFSFKKEPLEFGDLIGEDFDLSKQKTEFEFKTHYDQDGRIKIDIEEGDKWIRERQTTLNLVYKDKNFSLEELTDWMDKKLRIIVVDKEDKIKFIKKAIDFQLKNYSLSDLSINRFIFRDRMNDVVKEILINYAKKRFNKFIKESKIGIDSFEDFPDKIVLNEKMEDKFSKNLYPEIDNLNKEELDFVYSLDSDALHNINYWIRVRERKDPFYIQGWEPRKFYPDFIAITKKGNIIVLEWKGMDRISNEDTAYKIEVAKEWEKLGNGKLHFFLVHKENKEDILNKIKKL